MRFSNALRAFATAQGKPDLYHETITTAYVLLINERLDDRARELSWNDFAALNPDLFRGNRRSSIATTGPIRLTSEGRGALS